MIKNDIIKNLLFSDKPSEFFLYLKKCNKLSDFPELLSLNITLQNPFWHPEGNVFVHTLMVIDIAADYRPYFFNEIDAIEYMLGALCHDFGKPYTTSFDEGSLRSIMHDSLGLAPAYSLLMKIGLIEHYEKTAKYIIEHLKPIHLFTNRNKVSDSAILKLSKRINLEHLVLLSKADHFGRTDDEAVSRTFPAGDWLLQRYSEVQKKQQTK